MFAGSLEITAAEWEICDTLDEVVASHPSASIGSYPRREEGVWRVLVTVDSTSQEDAEAALNALQLGLGERVSSTSQVKVVT